MDDRLLTYREVADFFGISEQYVGPFLEKNKIPIVRMPSSRKWTRVRLSDINKVMVTEFLKNQKEPVQHVKNKANKK